MGRRDKGVRRGSNVGSRDEGECRATVSRAKMRVSGGAAARVAEMSVKGQQRG